MQLGVYLVNKVKVEPFLTLRLAKNDYTIKGNISPFCYFDFNLCIFFKYSKAIR